MDGPNSDPTVCSVLVPATGPFDCIPVVSVEVEFPVITAMGASFSVTALVESELPDAEESELSAAIVMSPCISVVDEPASAVKLSPVVSEVSEAAAC